MATNKKHKFIHASSLIGLSLLLTGCPEPGCLNPNPKYTFAITAAFTPGKDSVQVGDTIYLVSAFPSTLTPVGSQNPVDYSNANDIGSVITIIEYFPSKERKWAVYDFDFISLKGEAYNSKVVPTPEAAEQIRYAETNGKYELQIAIVPKKKGNFIFVLGGGYSDSRKVKGKDRCDRASFNLSLTNDQPANVALAEQWASGSIGDPGGVYSFTVY